MGTTADKLNKLIQTKNEIKQALQDKGVEVGDKFSDYADGINELQKIKYGKVVNGYAAVNGIETDIDASKIKFSGQMYQTFFHCGDNYINMDAVDTSSVHELNYLFDQTRTKSVDFSSWDVSGVTRWINSFYGCRLSVLDLSNWDTSSAVYLNATFQQARCDVINVTGWNTSNVVSFSGTFCQTNLYKHCDLIGYENLDTSKATTIAACFADSYYKESYDLHNWNIDKVTDISQLFTRSPALTDFNIDGWNFSNVTNMNSWIYSCYNLRDIIGNFSGLGNKVNTLPFNTRGNSIQPSSLSNDSIRNIVNALVDKSGVSGTFTLQLARELQSNIPDDIIAAASAKNWNIAFT